MTELPKDLGIKIGTKDEKLWTDMRARCEDSVRTMNAEIIVNQAIIALCAERIALEKGKLK